MDLRRFRHFGRDDSVCGALQRKNRVVDYPIKSGNDPIGELLFLPLSYPRRRVSPMLTGLGDASPIVGMA